MRRVLIAAVAAAATLLVAPAAHASCANGISWQGGFYYGTAVTVGEAAALSGGYIPACNDAVAVDPETGARLTPLEAPTPVALHRIAGLPARMGVAYGGRAYLAAGWLPQLRGHPLHRRFRAAAAAGACGAPWRLHGTVQAPPAPGAPVSLRTGAQTVHEVTLAATARVRGLTRAGYPYLAAGDRVDAIVRTCRGTVVAARVARAA